MTIIDYFIKDKENISREDYGRSRLLIIVLLVLITVAFSLFILSLFGLSSGITNLSIFIVLVCNLWFLKFKGNLDVTFFVTTILCTGLLILNTIDDNEYILSYDNKWFVIALITIFFIKPKWLTVYSIFLLGLQTFYFVMDKKINTLSEANNVILKEYLDNIFFFGLCYVLLRSLNAYQEKQNEILQKTNSQLENKTIQLLDSNDELEKFAYVVSHDLKAPLNNIVGFAGLLEKELSEEQGSKAYKYSQIINSGSNKLAKLVTDILAYSKLESSEQEQEMIDLNNLTEEIILSISRYTQSRNGKIELLNIMPTIMGQRSMLVQLLKNLIENGLKYNESDVPSVSIQFFNDLLSPYIRISDNGIGIKEEHYSTIFTMFGRLHADEKYEGTGIGLASCRKIINKMDGSIAVNSNLEKGTRFDLYFPRNIIKE